MVVAPIETERLRTFTGAEYDRMVELGFFGDEHVELIHGVLYRMSPQGAPHIVCINRLTRWLSPRAAQGDVFVQIQGPLALGESRPEPDVAIVPDSGDVALATHAHLVVEVADSSLTFDRDTKTKLYGSSGIPEMWIFNLVDREVEVHTQPSALGYRTRRRLGPDDELAPSHVDGVPPMRVGDLLP